MKPQFVFLLLLPFLVRAQSPYLSVSLKMDEDSLAGEDYKISMQICTPRQLTANSVYGSDSSGINFRKLRSASLKCGSWSETCDSTAFNSFCYGNQDFGFERVLKFTIVSVSSGQSMQVIVPIRYQSFVSIIRLEGLVFKKRKSLWVDIDNQRDANGYLNVRKSLTGLPVRSRFLE